jgi:hypothetical protein
LFFVFFIFILFFSHRVCGSPDKKLCELSRFQFRDGKQQEKGRTGSWRRWKWKTASEEKGREREVKFFWTGSRRRWKLFGKDEKLRISGYGH